MAFQVRVFFLAILSFGESKERIWRFDSDVSNTKNWEGGKLAGNCKGVNFAAVNTAPVYIHQLTTSEITLPADGEIDIVEDGYIEFKENNKCINLKPIIYHDWYDPDSWLQPENNAAIPDKQQIPCSGDDVVFPKIAHSRVSEQSFGKITIGSLKFDKEQVDQNKLYIFQSTERGEDVFFNPSNRFELELRPRRCDDPYGCLCHTGFTPCPVEKKQATLNCLNPIVPEDFCREICGAYLTFKPGKGPDLGELRRKLEEYSVDTHASRVKDYLGNEVLQVVFSEKEYTGRSLDEAQTFHKYLQSLQAENIQILESGAFHMKGGSSSGISIVFGTLAAVAVFFGLLFYLNGDTSVNAMISRLNTGRGSVFNVPFFARFDNTDENLIIDGHSESGSVLDIPKSFDNPMFGTPSTSSQHENPLYEVTKDAEE